MLRRLEADGLRNLRNVEIDLPDGLTIVSGRNGQGKTSLLEAAYLLATGRSFRTRRAAELVHWEGGPLAVRGRVTTKGVDHRLAVLIDEAGRQLVLDGAASETEHYLGKLVVVDLTGDRMAVLRGAPEERRRFLDRGSTALRPAFLRVLGEYRRAVQQRNALMRTGRGTDAELDAWDERVASASIPLHIERRRLVASLDDHVRRISVEILPSGRSIGLRYLPSPRAAIDVDPDRLGELFVESLASSRPRDRMMGHTGTGPHRDDLAVELDGTDLRRFGSAGQVRAAMIALKLGKLSLLREERGEPPLFLLDDFDTDLDEARMEAVAAFLSAGGFQTVVATSKESQVERLGRSSLSLLMDDGVIGTP